MGQGQLGLMKREVELVWGRALLVALLWVLFAQLVFGVSHLSITSDEPSHVVAGLTYLKTGSLWVPPRHGHPPLLNVLCALPLVDQPGLPDLAASSGWGEDFSSYVRAVLPQLGPVQRFAFLTRIPVILMTVLLAGLTYRWAKELFGVAAGIAALLLLTFDPNLLAHGQLATTDLGVTLLGLVALYAAWRESQSTRSTIRWIWVTVAGFFLGLTLASKGSGFVYAPAMGAIITGPHFVVWLKERRIDNLGSLLIEGFVLAGIAGFVLWAVYGFQFGPLPDSTLQLPFPAHIRLLQTILKDTRRIAFLRGETRIGGWWWYFFYTTAVKTPLPLLAAGLWSVGIWIRRGSHWWMKTTPLLFFPMLYWGTAVTSGMNIGHRHLLPTFPLVYIFISQLATLKGPMRVARRHWLHGIQLILLLGYAAGAIAVYPFYLSYFNQLAGGPSQGYRHLVDSNLAWGQSFIALERYMDEKKVPEVRLSYYTYTDPAAYGVDYEPLPPAVGVPSDVITPFAPQPAVYAISATPLQGVMVGNRDLYEWFRHREPTAQPGYGLLVYDVQPEDVTVDWVAQCTSPLPPLPRDAIEKGIGSSPRVAAFDCSQAWLYPEGDGYYLLAREPELTRQPFVSQNLAEFSLAYEQREPGRYQAFSLYKAKSPTPSPSIGDQVRVAPSAWSLHQTLTADSGVTPPLKTEGPLTFLGIQFDPGPYRPGDTIGLTTYWRITAAPEPRNLSVMGQLLTEDGALVSNTDGLGVPLNQWHKGDRIAQHHAITIPDETPPGTYHLQSGAYWLDTLERWSIAGQGDRMVVGEVYVKP